MQRLLERFWMDWWNRRAMDEMLAVLHPDYRQVDHRPVTMNGGSRDDWRRLMESWWELVPDVQVTRVVVLAGDLRRSLTELQFDGASLYGGGPAEWVMYVVNTAAPDGRSVSADLFDDRAAAEAFFAGGD